MARVFMKQTKIKTLAIELTGDEAIALRNLLGSGVAGDSLGDLNLRGVFNVLVESDAGPADLYEFKQRAAVNKTKGDD